MKHLLGLHNIKFTIPTSQTQTRGNRSKIGNMLKKYRIISPAQFKFHGYHILQMVTARLHKAHETKFVASKNLCS